MPNLLKISPQVQAILSISLLLIGGISLLYNYIQPNLATILCLFLSPIAVKPRYPKQYSSRYLLPAFVCYAIFFIVNMKVFFLLGFGMTLFYIIETQIGKLSEIPLLLLTIFSPTLSYLASIFTFPIKLYLSKWAAASLNFIKIPVTQTGNYFEYAGMSFTVDTACMGLNLLITSFILTLLWIAFLEIQQKKRLHPLNTLILLITNFIFVVFANYNRIIMLVVLLSVPDTFGHEIVGLLSLGLYICVPMYYLVKKSYQVFGIPIQTPKPTPSNLKNFHKYILPMLIILSTYLSYTYQAHEPKDTAILAFTKEGYKKEITPENIVKFTTDSTIIYLKPAVKFWGCDHSPLICWAASGYNFEKIQERQVNNKMIYTAELVSPTKALPTLYTAWWYDNGTDKTISQTQWRWKMMWGEKPYRLVNVSTLQSNDLEKVCEKWMLSEPTIQ